MNTSKALQNLNYSINKSCNNVHTTISMGEHEKEKKRDIFVQR